MLRSTSTFALSIATVIALAGSPTSAKAAPFGQIRPLPDAVPRAATETEPTAQPPAGSSEDVSPELLAVSSPEAPNAVVAAAPSRWNSTGNLMAIAGWGTFGLTYGASVLAGGVLVANQDSGLPFTPEMFFIPIAGPAIAGSELLAGGGNSNPYARVMQGMLGIGLWATAAAQLAGILIAIKGHLSTPVGAPAPATTKTGVTFSPGAPGGLGFTLAARF